MDQSMIQCPSNISLAVKKCKCVKCLSHFVRSTTGPNSDQMVKKSPLILSYTLGTPFHTFRKWITFKLVMCPVVLNEHLCCVQEIYMCI